MNILRKVRDDESNSFKDIKPWEKGDLVEVSDGYARNYLLPKGLAVLASEGNIKKAKEEKSPGKKKEKERQEAQN